MIYELRWRNYYEKKFERNHQSRDSYTWLYPYGSMFFGGPIIDFFTALLQGFINSGNPFAIRILTLVIGCVILAFGMTIVMESDAGTGPNDLVAISISDKLHTPFGITRTIGDVAFVVVGYVLEGVFGIGTLICAFLVGTVAEKFLPFQRKWIGNVIKKTV